MTQIPWETIIPIIIDAITRCIENGQDEQQIRRRVREPGGVGWFRVQRQTRRTMGLSRAEWREQGPAIMAEIKAEAASLSDADLDELVAEAKED